MLSSCAAPLTPVQQSARQFGSDHRDMPRHASAVGFLLPRLLTPDLKRTTCSSSTSCPERLWIPLQMCSARVAPPLFRPAKCGARIVVDSSRIRRQSQKMRPPPGRQHAQEAASSVFYVSLVTDVGLKIIRVKHATRTQRMFEPVGPAHPSDPIFQQPRQRCAPGAYPLVSPGAYLSAL